MSTMMDSDSSSDSSSSDDSEAMKHYMKAMSPKGPSTLAAATLAPDQSPMKSFDNLFTKAGLESDDDTSQPSGASTSASSDDSESSRNSPIQRSTSPKSPPKTSTTSTSPTPPSDRSSDDQSDSQSDSHSRSDSSSQSSDVQPPPSRNPPNSPGSPGRSSTESTSMKEDSLSRSSRRDGSYSQDSSVSRSRDSRSDQGQQKYSDKNSGSHSHSSQSEGSSRLPSHSESQSRSRDSRNDQGEQEHSDTHSESLGQRSHNEGSSRSSSHSESQSKTHDSRSDQGEQENSEPNFESHSQSSHSEGSSRSPSHSESQSKSRDSTSDQGEQEYSEPNSESHSQSSHSEGSSRSPSHSESHSRPSHSSSQERNASKSSHPAESYTSKISRSPGSSQTPGQKSVSTNPLSEESVSSSKKSRKNLERNNTNNLGTDRDLGTDHSSEQDASKQQLHVSQNKSGIADQSVGNSTSNSSASRPPHGSITHIDGKPRSPQLQSNARAVSIEEPENEASATSLSPKVLSIEEVKGQPVPQSPMPDIPNSPDIELENSIPGNNDAASTSSISTNGNNENNRSVPTKYQYEESSKNSPSPKVAQNETQQEIPKITAPKISILKRLEERRRALQTQSVSQSQGSSNNLATALIENDAVDIQKAAKSPNQESDLPVDNPKVSSEGNGVKLAVDNSSSKLDSQSEYDPRIDDREKWKALVKRSTLGSSADPRGSGKLRRGASEISYNEGNSGGKVAESGTTTPHDMARQTADNIAQSDDPILLHSQNGNNVNGWMPPALTTYGQNVFVPEIQADEKLDPPQKRDTQFTKSTTVPKNATSNPEQNFNPPVSEIELRPPPEDDSSLGSMGFLFPKTSEIANVMPQPEEAVKMVSVEPKRDPELVIHRLKPTVGGIDYEYYKSWILPGAQPPQPKQTTMIDFDREDPPGKTTVFKPKRVVLTPFPPSNYLDKVDEGTVDSASVATSPVKVPSETWAPTRLTSTKSQNRSSDEWEAWKQARNASLKGNTADSSTKMSIRSDISSASDWAPPRKPRRSNFDSKGGEAEEKNTSHSGENWMPPSQSARVDFSGFITSVPTPSDKLQSSKEQVVDKDFQQPSQVEGQENPVSTDSTSSHSRTSSDLSSTTTSNSTHSGKQKLATSNASASGSSRSESSESRSRQSAAVIDEGHFEVDEQMAETTNPTPTIALPKDEQPNASNSINRPAPAQKTISPITMCLCATLSIIVLGAIILTVVWIVTDRFGNTTPSPASVPVAPSPTTSPSLQANDLQAIIISASPSTESTLDDPDSAQSLALDWLSGNQFIASYTEEIIIQRFALAVIFYSTAGDSWINKDLWMSDINECDWYFSETVNEVCNADGFIDELDLKNNALSGEIPWIELVTLASELLILDLKSNGLSGPISDIIGDMVSLLVFDVKGNNFSGTIPSTFGQLADVRQLDLSQNRLSGSIPSELAFMSSLQSLRMNNNILNGTIPSELGQLSNVRSIYLSGNDFVGSMPAEICALELDNLEVNCEVECDCCTACGDGSSSGGEDDEAGDDFVDAELLGDPMYELIVGRYPGGSKALSNPSSPQRAAFEWLRTSNNTQISSDERILQRYALASLFYATEGDQWKTTVSWLSEDDECFWYTTSNTGMLCDSEGNMVEIHLRNNNLQGNLPMELIFLANSLEVLDLQGNEISGSIPGSIGSMGYLKQINLSSNNMFGIIPTALASLSNLRRIEFADNNLFSTIPTELGLLNQLEFLDLGSNQLTGTIPESLGSMESLAGLSLYKNFLSGTLPSTFSNLINLQLFYVDENELTGQLPTGFCQLNLEEFWSDCQEMRCTCCTTCCQDGVGCT